MRKKFNKEEYRNMECIGKKTSGLKEKNRKKKIKKQGKQRKQLGNKNTRYAGTTEKYKEKITF